MIITGDGRPLRGVIRVPGDKSIAHRALILNGIARGEATVRGLPDGEDVASTGRVLRELGVEITETAPSQVRIVGRALRLEAAGAPLDCANSGTTLRLMCGLLAGQPFHSVLQGDASLNRRPTSRIVDPLRRMGARFDGPCLTPPVGIAGRRILWARSHEVPLASAQVKSALLLAGLRAEGTTIVNQPLPSRDHTELMLGAMGVPIHRRVSGRDARVAIEGGRVPKALDVDIPGDVSSAAFLVVAATLVPGSEVELPNVGLNPTRIGLLVALERMGARIDVTPIPAGGGEPRGHLRVRSAPLSATQIEAAEVPRLIDELPVLALAATAAEGDTVIEGAGELRVKESDRISATAQLLRAMGARVEERLDGLKIYGGQRLQSGELSSHNDHRIAMAAAVAALAAEGETTIDNTECAAVSYPGFFTDLEALRS